MYAITNPSGFGIATVASPGHWGPNHVLSRQNSLWRGGSTIGFAEPQPVWLLRPKLIRLSEKPLALPKMREAQK
jgi:hypothetical protein